MSVSCKLLKIKFLTGLMLSLCFLCVYPAAAQTDQTAIELQSVNIAVGKAFNAVLDAEKAGANVTSLLNLINDANDQLAQAENAYRTGDITAASNKADEVLSIALQVTKAAQNTQQSTIDSTQTATISTLAFSVTGAVVSVIVLIVVWLLFKQRYINSLSDKKPEVIGQ
jgi:hypothetical protein